MEISCNIPTLAINGARIPLDCHYSIEVEGRRTTLYASPSNIANAIRGLLLLEGLISVCDKVRIVSAKTDSSCHNTFAVSIARESFEAVTIHYDLDWNDIIKIYNIFNIISSKRKCPYAVHMAAIFSGERLAAFTVDVSRHAAALKAAGTIAEYLCRNGPSHNIVAVTTGRISEDIVKTFRAVGIKIIISNHRPLYSGLAAAQQSGVALVMRAPNNKGLAVYTGHELIKGSAPRVGIDLENLPLTNAYGIET